MSISNHTNDNNDIINTTNKNDNNTMNNTSNSNNTNNSLWNDMVNEHTDINSDSPLYSSLLSLLSSPTKTLYIRNGVIHDPDGILALALMASPFVTAPISTLQFSMPQSLFGGDINPALILAAFNVSLVALIPNHYQESQQQQLNDDNNNNDDDSSDNVKAVQIKYKNNISDDIVYDSNNNNTTTSDNNSTTRSTHNSNSNNGNTNTSVSSSLSSCEQFSLNYIPSQTPFTVLPTSGLAVVRGVDIMNANVFITLPCLPIIDNNASNNTNNNDGNMNQNHTTTNNNSTINNNNNLNNNDNEVDSIESMILMRAAFSIPSVLTYSPIFPKNAYSTADIINEGGTGSGVMKPRKNMKRMNK